VIPLSRLNVVELSVLVVWKVHRLERLRGFYTTRSLPITDPEGPRVNTEPSRVASWRSWGTFNRRNDCCNHFS
jgi:hypothetical protein